MKSATLPSFWKAYEKLGGNIKARARKSFRLWVENPFHPSLHFKCINAEEDIWSVRISLDVRAIGVLEKETVTWFWIGMHDEYERFFS
jgi:hypothetical protein